MACQRNRIVEFIEYLSSLGVEVNWGKNKARGNKGFFKVRDGRFRIDISKNLSDEAALSVLVHEAAHYIHYQYDKKLKSLSFILSNHNMDIEEELISLTVDSIPKESVKPLFEARDNLKNDLKGKVITPCELIIKKRALNNLNSRISRLNKYYNSPTELFARSIEAFILNKEYFSAKAPLLYKEYIKAIETNEIPVLTRMAEILLK